MSSSMSPGSHPVLCALRDIDAGLDELVDANLWSLLDDEVLDVRVELERLASRISAQRLRATREVDIRGAAIRAGASSLRAWLVNVLRLHPGEATREVLLSAQLADDLPATAAALAAGDITPAAAAVIADSDAQLRRVATAGQRADAEATLAAQAATLPVRGLQHVAAHLRNRLDPDQGERLAKEEERQVARRDLRVTMNSDGSSRLEGYLDKEATALLRTALDPLAKPRPGADGEPDPRTPTHRMGDALVELVELALRSGQMPTQAGQPVQLVVTIGLDDLQHRMNNTHTTNTETSTDSGTWHGSPPPPEPDRHPGPFAGSGLLSGAGLFGGTGVGMLDTGLPLSVEAVRRLACDCQVIPVVLGAHGEPLNVGRASRDATPAIRRALDVRDGGCAFPACDRPPKWCIVHHIWHWEAGGPTSCANCVLLCGHHHRAVHHHGWDVCIESDGLPSFYPPTWIDPDRTPRRHHRLHPHPTPNLGPPGDGRHDSGQVSANDGGHAPVVPFTRRT